LRTDGDACASLNAVSSTGAEADAWMASALAMARKPRRPAMPSGRGAAAGAFGAGVADADVGAAAGLTHSSGTRRRHRHCRVHDHDRRAFAHLVADLDSHFLDCPRCRDGTSIVALSDSSVMSESSPSRRRRV
jgi:hypothetical protein